MMPTVRAATLAVGLACATFTAPSNTLAATPAVPRATAVAPTPAVDEPTLPAKLGLSIASIGALGAYLRRRARRLVRPARAAGSDLIAPSTVGAPGRGDDDRGAPR